MAGSIKVTALFCVVDCTCISLWGRYTIVTVCGYGWVQRVCVSTAAVEAVDSSSSRKLGVYSITNIWARLSLSHLTIQRPYLIRFVPPFCRCGVCSWFFILYSIAFNVCVFWVYIQYISIKHRWSQTPSAGGGRAAQDGRGQGKEQMGQRVQEVGQGCTQWWSAGPQDTTSAVSQASRLLLWACLSLAMSSQLMETQGIMMVRLLRKGVGTV